MKRIETPIPAGTLFLARLPRRLTVVSSFVFEFFSYLILCGDVGHIVILSMDFGSDFFAQYDLTV